MLQTVAWCCGEIWSQSAKPAAIEGAVILIANAKTTNALQSHAHAIRGAPLRKPIGLMDIPEITIQPTVPKIP